MASTDNTTHHVVRGKCTYCKEVGADTAQTCPDAPGAPLVMRELRCKGCGRLLGLTQRTQPVPAQCTDLFCARTPASRRNEERDSVIEYLANVEQRPLASIGELFGISRQGVTRVLSDA
jgi:phage FluMu protein Com